MATAFITHTDCLKHITPSGHPERVDRLMALYAQLDAVDDANLIRATPSQGADAHILTVHPQSHIDRIKEAAPQEGHFSLDGDTHMSPGSLRAAYLGVGAMIQGVDMVMSGEVKNAFAAMRPPGHHAERETPMGFCLFGNIAIAAKHALDVHGLERVAIVDFDVHHGNGTQDLLWNEPRTLFISSHQMPLYPGSGAPSERGAHDNVLNVPLGANTDGSEMRRVYERTVIPALTAFQPQLILISAGFDAHAADPLANLNWTTEDFVWVTDQICRVAQDQCEGRIISTLEGGYDLDALATSSVAHLKTLIEWGS
ncbi:MAG: histone deacetylase family protein [Litoreibacter sp.]